MLANDLKVNAILCCWLLTFYDFLKQKSENELFYFTSRNLSEVTGAVLLLSP